MERGKFDKQGRELPDDTPVAIPLGAKRPESLTEMMRRMIREDMSRAALDSGAESFDEANDFDVEEPDAELFATEYEVMDVDGEVLPVAQTKQKERDTPAGEEDPEGEDETREVDEDEDAGQRAPATAARGARARARDDELVDELGEREPVTERNPPVKSDDGASSSGRRKRSKVSTHAPRRG